MINLKYTVQTYLTLGIEDFIDAGLKQSDIVKAIKKIRGIGLVETFPSNSDIRISLRGSDDYSVQSTCYNVYRTLMLMLEV